MVGRQVFDRHKERMHKPKVVLDFTNKGNDVLYLVSSCLKAAHSAHWPIDKVQEVHVTMLKGNIQSLKRTINAHFEVVKI